MNKLIPIIMTAGLLVSSCSSGKYHYQKTDMNWVENKGVESELLYSLYMNGDAVGDAIDSKSVSYDGGVFINRLESFTIREIYSKSEIDQLFLVGTKFFF